MDFRHVIIRVVSDKVSLFWISVVYVMDICEGQVFGPRSLSDSHGLSSTFTDSYRVLTDLVFTRLSTADTDF